MLCVTQSPQLFRLYSKGFQLIAIEQSSHIFNLARLTVQGWMCSAHRYGGRGEAHQEACDGGRDPRE